MSEFNLSEKIRNLEGFGLGSSNPKYIQMEDVKEFIKILKIEICKELEFYGPEFLVPIINNLAGEKLWKD